MRPLAWCLLPLSFPPSFDFSLCLKTDTDSIRSLELLDFRVEVSLPPSLLPTQHSKCEPRSCQGAGLTWPDFAGGGSVSLWSWSTGHGQRPRTQYFRYFLRYRLHREQRAVRDGRRAEKVIFRAGFVSEMGETKQNKAKSQQRWMRSQAPAFGQLLSIAISFRVTKSAVWTPLSPLCPRRPLFVR